ncbi:MAG TPA: hypothetical protein VLD35_17465 [Caldimonas sp.]|nr:hypothetical protein [Caldimonas sp.]
MPTTPMSLRWSESWRVLAYSAALALAFIALQRLELALFSAFVTKDMREAIGGTAHDEERLAAEAEALAARARAAAATLPPGHRAATFRLGYEIGFASELLGSFVTSDAAVREKAGAVGAAHVAVAQAQARVLGLGEVAALPMRTAAEFFALPKRLEDDEGGLGARIEARLTPIHRHLYLLGAHVGAEAAKIESSGGKFALPPETLIRRHATLAGIAPALWQPLAADPRGATPDQVLARHRAALSAMSVALATLDADDPARPATPPPPSR